MKKFIYGLIVVGVLLTNPSVKNYKEFSGNTKDHLIKREFNFLIFSIYTDTWDYNLNNSVKKTYIGILGNFIHVKDNIQGSINN